MEDIVAVVKSFILEEFMPGKGDADLTPETPLITSGILDSIGTLKLVAFLEEKFDIELDPHELDVDYLGSLEDIAKLVQAKT